MCVPTSPDTARPARMAPLSCSKLALTSLWVPVLFLKNALGSSGGVESQCQFGILDLEKVN